MEQRRRLRLAMNEKSEEVIEQNFRDITAVCRKRRHATPASSSSGAARRRRRRRTEAWDCGGDCLENLFVSSLSQCFQQILSNVKG